MIMFTTVPMAMTPYPFQRIAPGARTATKEQPVDPHHLPASVLPCPVGEVVSFGVNKESYRYDSSSFLISWRQRLVSATHASISEVEAVPQNSRLFFRKPFHFN